MAAVAQAATSPSLGLASPFGILSGTYTNTLPGTTINGDLGYTTGPAVAPTVNGTTHVADGTYTQAGVDQGTALTDLNNQSCTFTFPAGAVDLASNAQFPTATYAPGVYCITGAVTIGAGGITLTGAGTHIFRMTGALNSVAGSVVTVAGGTSVCDVWWTPTGATTLGANSTFQGTVIDVAGVTIGSTVTWTGRALAFGGTVTTDTDTITGSGCSAPSTATLTLTKNVTNDSGGTKVVSDFALFVGAVPVTSGVATTTLAPGTYVVSEAADAGYAASGWTGDCAANGSIVLVAGDTKACAITNDDILVAASGSGTGVGSSSRRRVASSTVSSIASSTDSAITTTSSPAPVAATTSAVSGMQNGTPRLPNTGLPPDDSIPLAAVPVAIIVCALVLAVSLRRRKSVAIADAI